MRQSDVSTPAEAFLGNSPVIHRVIEQIKKAARTEVPVLITGESGTGKEVAARMLHDLSMRRTRPLWKVNCSAIPSQIFDNQIFGQQRGALAGANESPPGRLEQDDQGTLFLDEIGDLPFALQSKLLHAFEDFKAVRLGGMDQPAMDVRLICSTSRDLEAKVAKNEFRADLFYRINVLRIEMPSLRNRSADVPFLMNHFIRVYSDHFGGRPKPLNASMLGLLESYHWPGNIRELENLAKRYVVLGDESQILSALGDPSGIHLLAGEAVDLQTPLRVQTKRAVRHLERKIILAVLQANQGNRRQAARSLAISYRALLYKIKEAGLPPARTSKTRISRAG